MLSFSNPMLMSGDQKKKLHNCYNNYIQTKIVLLLLHFRFFF